MAVDLSFGGTAFPRALEIRRQLYETALGGATTRYRILDRLDAFQKCLEYAHQEQDWNGNKADLAEVINPEAMMPFGWTAPGAINSVSQRRPTAPLRLSPMVVDRFTGLLFSEKRTPVLTVEDDEVSTDFLAATFKRYHFWRTMVQARTFGGSMGSTMVTAHLKPGLRDKGGRFAFKAHNPKTVQEVLWEDADLKIPAGVLVQFIFFREMEVLDEKTGRQTGRSEQIPFLFRRIIDEEMDLYFKPARIVGSQIPNLEVDLRQSSQHRLGRFPGVWIQNLPQEDELDGVPDCAGSYQMFEAIDRQLAQANKALLANQDPTVVISRDVKSEKLGIPLRKGSENALNVGPGGSASYLEIGGAGVKAAQELVKDLRQAAMDKVQCVLVDPELISGAAQSAKAIEYIYAPMLEKAGRLREQYGEAIEQMAEIVLEMARIWSDPLQYEGRAVPKFDLPPRMEETDLDADNPNVDPQRTFITRQPGKGHLISLRWGQFFSPTLTDAQTAVGAVSAAVASKLLDIESAIEQIAPYFGIEDVENLKRKIREEAAQEPDPSAMGLGQMPGGMELPPDELPPDEGLPPDAGGEPPPPPDMMAP